MKYKLHDEIVQGSPEWIALKIKIPLTGTQAFNLLKKGKIQAIKDSQKAQKNSLKYSGPISKYAKWGTDNEPIARNLLNRKLASTKEFSHIQFEEHGFIESLDYPLCGYSPDGVCLIKNKIEYLCEIKSFQIAHAWKIWENEMPDEHIMCQIQWGLFLSGAQMCFFCLYCPFMNDETLTPDRKRHPERVLYIQKIYPNNDYFEAFAKALQ